MKQISPDKSKTDIKHQLLELLMLDICFFGDDNNNNPPPVTNLSKPFLEFLKEYPVGGVVLFSQNLQNPEEIVQLTNDLQQHSKSGRLIAVDQEGGIITRINGACEMPGNMALGALDKPEMTTKAAEILADELCLLGFNYNFAPVVDVNSNPHNPVIGVRSFGSNAELVAQHGKAYCDGLDRKQIISCAKHFPGHGDTACDSHHELPFINRSFDEFNNLEFIPFKTAFKGGVDSIMTAHIVAPQLDNKKIYSYRKNKYVPTPATLSKTILTDLLRKKLSFKGLIVSDSLDMKAISDYFDPVEKTLRCIEAGIDIALIPFHVWNPNGIKNFSTFFDTLIKECSKSQYLRERVSESYYRIVELKMHKVQPLLKKQQPINERKILVNKLINNYKHRIFQKKIAASAITLVVNETGTLPWNCNKTELILILSENSVIAEDGVNALKELGYQKVVTKLFDEYNINDPDLPDTDKILVLSYNLNNKKAKTVNRIIHDLNNFEKPYVMLSCHSPYDILYLDNVRTNVLVFGSSGYDQTNSRIRRFSLNLTQAIKKIMLAKSENEFIRHLPVELHYNLND